MSDFIVPPPGLVPDAPQPTEPDRTVRAPAGGVPAFRPTVPGSPVPAPPGPAGLPDAPPARSRGPRTAWQLRSDAGQTVVVSAHAVLGRDPRRADAADDAEPVVVHDPARSVSKTHALLEVVDDRLIVTDLHSTNGVRIWPDGAEAIELEAGLPTSVPEGAVLLLGDVAFLVGRAPGDDGVP